MNDTIISERKEQVELVVKSKIEEFHLLGYGEVREENLWDYLQKKKWKKVKEELPLHHMVNDILTVKVMDIMNYITIQSYKGSRLEELNNQEDFSDLFK
ncbi:post-transcriptional regulator [Bacillus sp. CGMCC 1.16541]|uniref:post-transcriptional regulator n=1 Tax=Bacillus sp. CGMCC 1.16541 TaxID=2185143 RepID=UPI000D73D192|nr:post-transcriptional regulator [Bacillus sp. CGMCC 1.16541]